MPKHAGAGQNTGKVKVHRYRRTRAGQFVVSGAAEAMVSGDLVSEPVGKSITILESRKRMLKQLGASFKRLA